MSSFRKLTASAVWAAAIILSHANAAPPPTRAQAAAILEDLMTALKVEDAESVMDRFHRAPEWSDKQFKNQVYSLFEIYADGADLTVIEDLARAGSWGTAGEQIDKERVRRQVALHGVKPEDCHALVSKKAKAEAIFHWNGAKFTILHYSDAARRKALHEYLEEGLEGIQGTDNTGIAMSFFQLSNLGPEAELAIPALSKYLVHDNPQMRVRAAITLWKIDRKATVSVPPLLEILADPKMRASDRAFAADCLGLIGPEAESAAAALQAAMAGEDAKLRVTSAWALWRTTGESETTIPVFLGSLHDRDASHLAANAIAKMAWEFHADPARLDARNRLVQQVIESSTSDEVQTRRRAIGILSEIGATGKPVREALEKATKDEDLQVRVSAAEALKKAPIPTKNP